MRIEKDKSGKLKAITTVYSYRFPEVRSLITELTNPFPHDIFLKSTQPCGDLDDFHESIIDKVADFYSGSVNLSGFNFKYPTAGSSEGIFHYLSLLRTNGTKKIYTLKSEYEGFKEYGKSMGIKTVEIEPDTDPEKIEKGIWFLSNPSARDGNIISNQFVNDICDAGHKVFYDLAYMDSAELNKYDLEHENIAAAVISFSKPYGVFYDRIGFAFSREEIPSLYANKWFKNILSLMIADKIVSELEPNEIYKKYRPVQKEILKEINKEHELGIKPSDALLLGYLTKNDTKNLDSEQRESIEKFRRGYFYRFCLTPYFLDREIEGLEIKSGGGK